MNLRNLFSQYVSMRLAIVLVVTLPVRANAVVETLTAGSFIINMGVIPQTVGNGLKPYGMIYDLMSHYNVPVKWVIGNNKVNDLTKDFTYGVADFKGGTFIIPAEFISTAVNARIVYWQSLGVVGVKTTSPLTVDVDYTLTSIPRWTLDATNGGIAQSFLTAAGIPVAGKVPLPGDAYNWKVVSLLDCCDDFYVMPHADPTWLTHNRLYTWNKDCLGSIWLGCHAGSAFANSINPSNSAQQMNFLMTRTNIYTPTPWPNNSLILWGSHSNGSIPYARQLFDDPVAQYVGASDLAHLNGSEQIYIPKQSTGLGGATRWNPGAKIICYDPTQVDVPSPNLANGNVAGVIVYGHAFDSTNRGMVMYEGGHNIGGTAPANISAQRAFMNFSFIQQLPKAPQITTSGLTNGQLVYGGIPVNPVIIATSPFSGATFTYKWTSTCGGTFLPGDNIPNPTFIPPTLSGSNQCMIACAVSDQCGRKSFSSTNIVITCPTTVTSSIVNPCFNTPNGGAINLSVSNGTPPYLYTWSSSSGGTGSGSGLVIPGLSAGTYTVTVTDNNGTGCSKTFSTSLSTSPQINIQLSTSPILCAGGTTGAINLTVTGGIPGYSYLWSVGSTNQNLSGLGLGTYTVTVTDSKGCTATQSASLTAPAALTVSSTIIDVLCYGQNTGSITLSVAGGTTPYLYLWNDGSTAQSRTGLAAATYTVTVTDVNFCSKVISGLSVAQPSSGITVSTTASTILCFGDSATITAVASGGTGTLQYSLNGGPYQAGSTFKVVGSNNPYTVTVKDANNCTKTASVSIPPVSPINLSTVVTNSTCPPPAAPNGSIDLSVTGGVGPYIYSWTSSNGFTSGSQDITSLGIGTYTVLVTDQNGCAASVTINITTLNSNPVQPGTITH